MPYKKKATPGTVQFNKSIRAITTTVGFHNFNLRIFILRVSNPNKLIVDVF